MHRFVTALVLFLLVSCLGVANAGQGLPTPMPPGPILANEFQAFGYMYLPKQNITMNASVWYDYDDKVRRGSDPF
jgi:hypothetical protein